MIRNKPLNPIARLWRPGDPHVIDEGTLIASLQIQACELDRMSAGGGAKHRSRILDISSRTRMKRAHQHIVNINTDVLAARVATVRSLYRFERDYVICVRLKAGDRLRNCSVSLDERYLDTLRCCRGNAREGAVHATNAAAIRETP